MNILKGLVTTLVTVLIFISAVELITPSNKMKKYIQFVLGLILITVILNPILELVSNGQSNFSKDIEAYEEVFSKNQNYFNLDENSSSEQIKNEKDIREKAFIKNFNENCNAMLNSEFKNMQFKSEVECNVDFNNMNINIKKLRIGITDKNIRKIQKVSINNNDNNKDTEENQEMYKEIVDFASKELEISKEKIEVYKLEE